MLPNNDGLSISPDEERGVNEVQMLIHVLLGCQVEQDVIRLRMQDVYMPWRRGQEGWKGSI